MKNAFLVKGLRGKLLLRGSVSIGGAKNAAVKVMAASTLFEDSLKMTNVPEIEDTKHIGEILRSVGVEVSSVGAHERMLVPQAIKSKLDSALAQKSRSSIVITGPVLARTGKVVFPNPGGCNLGSRPIDLFLSGYEKFGAVVEEKDGEYVVTAKEGKLRGADIFFRVQSHTATETLMMAATLAEGTTTLRNCALEPEVKSLADFLVSCGASITGAGTSTIVIEGGKPLRAEGKVYKTMPDRLEASSFLVLGALTAEELTVRHCHPAHLEIVIEILRTAGVSIETTKDSITVRGTSKLKAVNVRTHEYPGLATDLQAPMGVFLTQTEGTSAIFETIYEGRLGYLEDLKRMGASVEVQDTHRALIHGPTPLHGQRITASDIRAGLAMVIAGLVAEGETIIDNAYMIDRGYERLEEKLKAIGAEIERV